MPRTWGLKGTTSNSCTRHTVTNLLCPRTDKWHQSSSRALMISPSEKEIPANRTKYNRKNYVRNELPFWTQGSAPQPSSHSGRYSAVVCTYSCSLTLSLLRVISFKFPLQPHQKYYITVWRTWLFIAYSDERWLYYQFSLPHLYIFSIKG